MNFNEQRYLSIIIVNYNTHWHLTKCLASIKNYITGLNFEVIMVDNNSPDRGIEKVAKDYPEYNFIFLNENRGFGAGCNRGVMDANGKYVLFLNPDIELLDDSILRLSDFLEKNQDAGACSGLLLDDNSKLSYNFNYFPSYSWEFKEAFGINVTRTIKNLLSNPNISLGKPFEVDWFHGACLMVRKELLDKIGGFDENIFLYYEDVDLQKRIKEEGFKIFCIPTVKVYHATQSSVKTLEGQKILYYNMHFGKLIYFKKHCGIFKTSAVRLIYIVAYILKLPLIFIRRKFKGQRKIVFSYYIIILKVYLTKHSLKRV